MLVAAAAVKHLFSFFVERSSFVNRLSVCPSVNFLGFDFVCLVNVVLFLAFGLEFRAKQRREFGVKPC